jgi:Ca-activated chloride channel homolog
MLRLPLVMLVATFLAAGADGPRLLDSLSTRQTAKDPAASIRVNVDMTLVPVVVLDPIGHNVSGLQRENFRVFDGPEQRPIVSFGRQDAPITVGLVFDCSRSMTSKFAVARKAPAELYHQLNPQDESFLVTVADRAILRQGLTSNFEDIENALLFVNPNGTTSLLDGVYTGLMELKKSHKPRKALVVVSDGGENYSRYSMRELASLAQESDAQIFTIGLCQNPETREENEGPELLGKLAGLSGGLEYLVNDMNELHSIMGRIGITLHDEYLLGYYPPESVMAGKYRKIKVQLVTPAGLPKFHVYARSGYFVPRP